MSQTLKTSHDQTQEAANQKEVDRVEKPVNYIFFVTGLLSIGCSIILLVFVKSTEIVRLTYSLLAIGIVITLSQIPILINLKLSNGITAGGAAAFAAMIYLFNPGSMSATTSDSTIDSTQEGKYIPPDCNNEKVNIAIFSGGNLDYTRAIKTFFLNTLQPKMNFYHNKCLYYEDYYVTSETKDTARILDEISRTNIMNRDFDYYVTIGTSASIGLNKFFEKNNMSGRRFIFLGVTDPVLSGLVNTFDNRNENSNIAGVAYCGNFENLPVKIHEFYPNDTLVYVYNTANSQDVHIASRLQNIPLNHSGKLILKPFYNQDPTDSDFEDSGKVYFSWVTLETFFSTDKVKTLRNIKKIVSTTQTHSELGLVPLAVSTSDEEIGKKGADIILLSLKEPKLNLGALDIYIPKWRTYVNKAKALEKKLDWQAIKTADKTF